MPSFGDPRLEMDRNYTFVGEETRRTEKPLRRRVPLLLTTTGCIHALQIITPVQDA
jgi:hypothetical protein